MSLYIQIVSTIIDVIFDIYPMKSFPCDQKISGETHRMVSLISLVVLFVEFCLIYHLIPRSAIAVSSSISLLSCSSVALGLLLKVMYENA